MIVVPESLSRMLSESFRIVSDPEAAASLRTFAETLYEQAYEFRFQHRQPDDNRVEHELVVLRQTVRICWRSGKERTSEQPFSLSELRVGIATAILHDLRYLRRITEEEIQGHLDAGRIEVAARLKKEKAEQRMGHMRGGAEDAGRLLGRVPGLMTADEIRQCLGYISLHDVWKLGWPYPLASDWLAVCCLEGDALFPLEPGFGPRADLERKDIAQPTQEQQREQAASNLRTQLMAYRENFTCTAERFTDAETIVRTREGAAILREYRQYWGI